MISFMSAETPLASTLMYSILSEARLGQPFMPVLVSLKLNFIISMAPRSSTLVSSPPRLQIDSGRTYSR